MKSEINNGKKNGKSTNMWRLRNMLLKNQQVNEKIRKYLKINKSRNSTFQNVYDVAVLKGEFIVT